MYSIDFWFWKWVVVNDVGSGVATRHGCLNCSSLLNPIIQEGLRGLVVGVYVTAKKSYEKYGVSGLLSKM